ncbi:MAG: sacsin N-terminal ATP-binding-like domain-containing protein, partial [Nostoc sp.]
MPSNYTEIKQHNVIDYGTKFKRIGEFLAKQLYNDQTHFIYELLQNTEDALSRQNQNDPNSNVPKSITFRLYSDHLEVSHFGKSFDEADVRGICNILEGTKQEDEKQIGKFGIGFKSVYAFTSSPEIYSGSEHFKIEEYIYPCSINPRELLPGETVFIFPFNHKSELPKNTFYRIFNKLDSLKPSILLFLCYIEEISWNVEDGSTITYRREMQPIAPNCRKVIVIGKGRQEWLVFD